MAFLTVTLSETSSTPVRNDGWIGACAVGTAIATQMTAASSSSDVRGLTRATALPFFSNRRATHDEIRTLAGNRHMLRRNEGLRPGVRHQILMRELVRDLLEPIGQGAGGEDVVVAAAGFVGALSRASTRARGLPELMMSVGGGPTMTTWKDAPASVQGADDLIAIAVAELRSVRRDRDDDRP